MTEITGKQHAKFGADPKETVAGYWEQINTRYLIYIKMLTGKVARFEIVSILLFHISLRIKHMQYLATQLSSSTTVLTKIL